MTSDCPRNGPPLEPRRREGGPKGDPRRDNWRRLETPRDVSDTQKVPRIAGVPAFRPRVSAFKSRLAHQKRSVKSRPLNTFKSREAQSTFMRHRAFFDHRSRRRVTRC